MAQKTETLAWNLLEIHKVKCAGLFLMSGRQGESAGGERRQKGEGRRGQVMQSADRLRARFGLVNLSCALYAPHTWFALAMAMGVDEGVGMGVDVGYEWRGGGPEEHEKTT